MKSARFSKSFVVFLLFLAALVIFGISSCINQDKSDEVKDTSRNFKNNTSSFIYNVIPQDPNASITPEYSTAINLFSVNLLREVYTDALFKSRNIILSPFSVSRSLSIIAEGATGKSKSELLEALGGQTALDDAKSALSDLLYADKSIILQCADAIWVDSVNYSLNQSFKEKASTKFGVKYYGLDFIDKTKCVNFINNWVNVNTNKLLSHVIDENSIPSNTALVLTNAIYFKADWTSPFDITKTQTEPFYSPNGSIQVKMMNSGYIHKTRKTSVYENAKIFYGTLKTEYFYLDIYMPTTVSIEKFLQNSCLSAISSNDSSRTGSLKMPKFSFTSNINLIPMLKQLGIKEVFNSNNLDLTGIVQNVDKTENESIYIDKIKHVAGIETDEEGTKAYATTIIRGAGSSGPSSPDVVLNKPFVYFIRGGHNGLILFAGVVNNPNAN